MIRLAFYQPDIPQNMGSAIRLCAALGMPMEIIEPCGFIMDDKRMGRVAMDYIKHVNMTRHLSWEKFLEWKESQEQKPRIILMTTKSETAYTDFKFQPNDILLAGRESAGVPEEVHNIVDARITIPLIGRSLNIIQATCMITGEALRQTEQFPSE